MKLSRWTGAAAALLLAAGMTAGCGKRDDRTADESGAPGKVTGKASDAPVKLEVAWKADQRLLWRMELEQHSEFPGFGRQKKMTNDTVMAQEYSVTVTNAPEPGLRGAEMEILAIELQTAVGDMELKYDSANKVMGAADNPLAQALSNLIGGKIYFLLGADNKVVKMQGTKELFDRVDGPAGGPRRGMGIGAMLRKSYGDDQFKQMIEMSGMPDKPVRIGDKWEVNKVVGGGMIGDLALNTTQEFKGWQTRDKRKCARVDFAGTIAGAGTNSLLSMMGRMEIQNGRIEGTTWVDPVLCLPVEAVIDQKMDIHVTPNAPAARQGANATAGATNAAAPWTGVSSARIKIKLLESERTDGK